MIKHYYSLAKPGLVYGNLISTIGGFLLASHGQIDFRLLFATIIGISLVMASGCVLNCYIDRDIDAIMKRTQNRVLVKNLVSQRGALIYAITLLIIGIIALLFTNLLTLIIAMVGFIVYVFLYTIWLKRTSIHSTMVGSVAGSVPVLVGYCAVTNQFNLCAIFLFLILAVWQMPHSYALYIGCLDDYTKASISALPVKKGIYWTKVNIILYVISFFFAMLMLYIFHYTGAVYLIIMTLLSAFWIILAYMGFHAKNNRNWARKLFFYSILVILTFSVLISFDWLTPKF
ncbi:MAG: heme o synthase [Burkholderiales bacterium]|nr:heme o synthase [Burkholderiales bacterium]